MPKIYDKDSNELAEITDDELSKLSDILKGDEESKNKLADLTKEHDELKEKYAGLENKDFNFRNFEKASKEEQDKLMEKMSEIEKASVKKISELSSELETTKKDKQDAIKAKAISALSNGDEELQKELEKAYDKSLEFGGNPKTEDDVVTRMSEAYRYVKGSAPSVNALNAYTPNTPVIENKSERFTDSDKGKKMLEDSFPSLYPKKKED